MNADDCVAMQMIRETDLPMTIKIDLRDQYREDRDEHSVHTATEKLEQGISDAKENQKNG